MTFSTGNIQGSYEWDGSTLRITIDGSGHPRTPDGRKDWFTNFFFVPVVGVHAGYLYAAYRVSVVLAEQIQLATSVEITGHSLGGAVAEVLAAGIKHKYVTAKNLGGPRPWKRQWFADWATGHADITWYSAGTDIVPWIPPWYRHAGQHVHIRTNEWSPFKNHLSGYKGVT